MPVTNQCQEISYISYVLLALYNIYNIYNFIFVFTHANVPSMINVFLNPAFLVTL